MTKEKNKKIAIFMSSFRAGGGERNLVNMANYFVKKGFIVDIPVLKPVGPYKEHLDNNVKIHNLDAGRIIFSIPKFIKYLIYQKPDIVLSTDEFTHIISIISKFISRSKSKTVIRMGNMFSVLFKEYKSPKQKIVAFISKKVFKYANVVIANSHGVAMDVSKVFGINLSRISVINNPKNINFILEKSLEKTGLDYLDNKSIPVILSVCRLRKQKGLETLIRAFAIVRGILEIKLIIVGSGRDEGKLRDLVKSLDLDNDVNFYGFSDNPYSFMSKADLYISTSLWEGFSNSLQEALVCGAFCIATDCNSGPREMLSPETDPYMRLKDSVEYTKYGVLIPVENHNILADIIISVLKDEKRLLETKINVKKIVNRFDNEFIMNRYIRTLNF